MAEFYKVIIIEMPRIEWENIVEGIKKAHAMSEFSDEAIETFVKESTVAWLNHAYVDFVDEMTQNEQVRRST